MEARGLTVPKLEELDPSKYSARLLGLTLVTSKGWERTPTLISIRLREHKNSRGFLTSQTILDTMLHEMCHLKHGPHGLRFRMMWKELRAEFDDCEHAL
ncbi:WLM-domain-containing protein [Lophiostoma macrostomum CBS 122681]|uniref:WLM-domain-containing protein n=1 Tax=Lophiostoma macrostomum CBS 122681 TaxID=1314788 RepID=A0A6A6TGM6_9PLEO|nr:WLM-domain-containing protein [Lophiostoma macrostomum CBS 122681]